MLVKSQRGAPEDGYCCRRLIVSLALCCCCLVGFAQEKGPANSRLPSTDTELKFWLNNMVRLHGFSTEEVVQATGLTAEAVTMWLERFQIDREAFPSKRAGLLMRPYPGGRHPRIGFLDGAIRPQRETKISVFTPWAEQDYVVIDVPEALWSNLGLTYLAHTHVETVFDKQGVELRTLEWERCSEDSLNLKRVLPNGIVYECRVRCHSDHVRMQLQLTNDTKHELTDLRVQNCVMLKAAQGFNAQSNENKTTHGTYAVCCSDDGKRYMITAWTPLHRVWFNERCPCLHSDPVFPDCDPGQTVFVEGWFSFYEGENLEEEIRRIESLDWEQSFE